ncbi:TetR/AcrR family transcriptional regulator [uncultured Ruegeria sp.]|uniref:TetR/AcrR family transcriptional regulator n=1 Tax=uncultured Ruegeria sp. TaxID=259304 RepID=UPI002624AC38|nr:TetR/AcrR family transcriptional regulator [uncultured Ruegeria sp.]
MSGHERRRLTKTNSILKSAEELFSKHGVRQTSVDDIAEHAGVGRMTIFNYFGSKDGVIFEMMRSEFEQGCEDAELILDQNIPFEGKLEAIIGVKERALIRFGGAFVVEAFTKNTKLNIYRVETLAPRIDAIVSRFFAQGKDAGLIDPDIPDDTLMAYFRVFSSGLSAEGAALAANLEHPNIRSTLIRMYFAGLTRSYR